MTDEKRPYRMKRRAELEASTRLRITESAVALHGTLGPARTSISAIAEHAGVRRSTVYRHFADEAALFAACSSHWRAADPAPPPAGGGGGGRSGENPPPRGAGGESGARPGGVAGDRRSGQTPARGAREALRALPADRADAGEPLPRRGEGAERAGGVLGVPRLSRRCSRRPDARARPSRQHREARARGGRARALVRDVAVAGARAEARRPPGGRTDVQARLGRRRKPFAFLAPSFPPADSTAGERRGRSLLVAMIGGLALAAGAAAASAPTAVTGPVTASGSTSATVGGTVNPNGQATTWLVQYGRATSYGSPTRPVQARGGKGGAKRSTTNKSPPPRGAHPHPPPGTEPRGPTPASPPGRPTTTASRRRTRAARPRAPTRCSPPRARRRRMP